MSDPEDAGLLSYGIFGITASQIRDDFQNTDINEAGSDGSASFISRCSTRSALQIGKESILFINS